MDGEHLTLKGVVAVAYAPSKGQAVGIVLSEKAWRKVRRTKRAVEEFIAWGEVFSPTQVVLVAEPDQKAVL